MIVENMLTLQNNPQGETSNKPSHVGGMVYYVTV